MSAPPGFYQVAYVTNDFERALQSFRQSHGIHQFARLPAMRYPTGPGREAVCDVALAYVGCTEFEVICPQSGDVDIYRDYLPGSGFGLRFHHLGRLYHSMAELEQQLERHVQEGRILPINAAAPGSARYFYADHRAELGHYIEHICFEPAARAWLAGIPRN
jgi:hypothetical protein